MTNDDDIDKAQKILSGICLQCNLAYTEIGHKVGCPEIKWKQMNLQFEDEEVTWSDIQDAEKYYWS